jgi:hypothetical protein
MLTKGRKYPDVLIPWPRSLSCNPKRCTINKDRNRDNTSSVPTSLEADAHRPDEDRSSLLVNMIRTTSQESWIYAT